MMSEGSAALSPSEHCLANMERKLRLEKFLERVDKRKNSVMVAAGQGLKSWML